MPRTINEMLLRQTRLRPEAPALRTRTRGQWVTRSWAEWSEAAHAIAAALTDLGVRRGDRVGLLAGSRREWAEICMGIQHAGAAVLPLHPQCTAAELGRTLKHASCGVLFVEDALQAEKVFDPRAGGAGEALRSVVFLDAWSRLDRPDERGRLEVRLDDAVPRAQRSRLTSLAELLGAGRALLDREGAAIHKRAESVEPTDLAALLYTSGTTGEPRGVPLSHGNFAWECEGVEDQLGLGVLDQQLLVLPLAHVFAQLLLVSAVRAGCCTAFARSPLTALEDAKELEPTYLGAVPRVFSRVRAGVERRLELESPLRRRAAEAAFRVGLSYSDALTSGAGPSSWLKMQHRAADVAVLESVRHSFGRKLRFALSGGAPLSAELARWFHACGVLVLEGYGLTETTGATHVNRPGHFRFGSVGLPVPGVETQLAPDGEVLVRGGNVLQGYFGDASGEVGLDAQGWLHTGDLGRVDAEGFLFLTGRKKDVLITTSGKKVAPAGIENALRAQPWIGDAVLLGDGRSFLAALLVLDEDAVAEHARRVGHPVSAAALARDPGVLGQIARSVAAVNAELEPWQRIQRYEVLERPFSVEQGELTASLKVRRAAVCAKHEDAIERLYTTR